LRIKDIVCRWLDAAMPHRQGPQIGKVLSFGSGSGTNEYSARVRILKPGSLEETETVLEEVPTSPLWASSNGAGVYAPLPEDTLVIVGYIEHNPSYPYIEGVWGEYYDSADFKSDEFLITNGIQGIKIKTGEIHFNGDGLGGLVKIETLKRELTKNVGILNAALGVVRGTPILEPGNGGPSALQAALKLALGRKTPGDFAQIENETVKHG